MPESLCSKPTKVPVISKEDTHLSTVSRVKYRQTQSMWRITSCPESHETMRESYRKRIRKKRRIRRRLVIVAMVNAGLSILVSVTGYFAIQPESTSLESLGGVGIWLKSVLATVSLIQASLLFLYHSSLQRYTALQHSGLRVCSPQFKSLYVLEYLLHSLVLIPESQVTSLSTGFTTNHCLYLALIFRNYDLIRAGYWFFTLDSLRIPFFKGLMGVKNRGFEWKYWLHQSTLCAVISVYGLVVVFTGVIWNVINTGHIALLQGFLSLPFTNSLIGSDSPSIPSTFPTQLTLLFLLIPGFSLSVIFIFHYVQSRFALSNREEQAYRAIMYTYDLVTYRYAAVVLIQSWWRKAIAKRKNRFAGVEIERFVRRKKTFKARKMENNREKSQNIRMQIHSVGHKIHMKMLKFHKELLTFNQGQLLCSKLSLSLLRTASYISSASHLLLTPHPLPIPTPTFPAFSSSTSLSELPRYAEV